MDFLFSLKKNFISVFLAKACFLAAKIDTFVKKQITYELNAYKIMLLANNIDRREQRTPFTIFSEIMFDMLRYLQLVNIRSEVVDV